MTKYIQASTTVNSRRVANRIAHSLLNERLAGCVQVIGPVDSRYWWEGRIEHDKEWLLQIKAKASDYPRIESAIKKLHPYKVPEIVSYPVSHGNSDYLEWISKETSRRSTL